MICAAAGLVTLRRWSVTPVLLCGLMLLWMAPSVPRARWAGPSGGTADAAVVRVMTFNALARNPNIDEIYERIAESEADVITVIEAPHELIARIRERGGVPGRFEYWDAAEPGHWWNVVRLSRWPLSWAEVERDEKFRERRGSLAYQRSLIVMHPEQPFLVTAVFPQSPRSRARWENGNAEIRLFGEILQECFAHTGLPIVVCADVNGSPTGYRTRLIAEESGLLRSKPWWSISGTWPSVLPGFLRTPIDDVLVSSGIAVRDWKVLGWTAGSDHAPVLVELALPRTEIEVPNEWLAGGRAPDRHLGADRR
ncbi:MAG: endonuclease/exonuclease/phosphatase family protein [Phycisphaeraceae bacterium]|nr:MAG: endonuclease/exonuclease/phosphatase family protein [Phycisphaeraceae bacterium]